MILKTGKIAPISKQITVYSCTLYTLTNTPIVTIVSGDKEFLKYQSEQLRQILGDVDHVMDLVDEPID